MLETPERSKIMTIKTRKYAHHAGKSPQLFLIGKKIRGYKCKFRRIKKYL